MPEMNMIQALNDALKLEFRRDPTTMILGEDVGKLGGVFRVSLGLIDEFGDERVVDSPLTENGIIGAAIGLALGGMRPIAEIQFADYIWPGFDQIVNEMAKMRYRSGGEYNLPMVVRTPCGGGIHGGHYHSQSPEAYFVHTAGLKVVMPSTPYDAKGMLLTAIRDEDPVIFFEPKRIYRAAKGEVPDGDYTVPFGEARIEREGTQCTVISYGATMVECRQAADLAAEKGISIELIDLRSLSPWDEERVLSSVKKTGRAVIVHEAPRSVGYGAEVSATIHEECMLYLEAPVQRVTGFDTPFPYTLEREYMPDAGRILAAVEKTLNF